MAEKLEPCPFCGTEYDNKLDEYRHFKKWGCPVAYKKLTLEAAPLCACGCREKVGLSKRNPKLYNKYVRGHNKRKIHAKIAE
jgi:hypothetical protein